MHRLLVALLAALDAVIATAGGVVVVLAPLTLLWVVGFGADAQWSALWPAGGAIWQLGHLVPLDLTLPPEYLAVAGIDPNAATFTLSLAPLAIAAFTALFAARSGRRAAQAGAPVTGAVTGALVFTALAAVVAATTANPLAAVQPWQAVVFPALVFTVPAVVGALVEAWRIDDHGAIARLRTRVEDHAWGALPALAVRGTAVAATGLVGIAAVLTGAVVLLRGGEIVALFETAHVDAAGVVVLALAQLAYLPTLIVWSVSFLAGPGFALGDGTAVSAAGTQLGVLPGIPVLGVVPASSTTWLLLLVLLPVAVGVLTGWMLRSRLAAQVHAARDHDGGFVFRLVLAASVSIATGALAALAALAATGSIGPGRLAHVGPDPGAVALTVGTEVLVGAAILLLLPRRASDAERIDAAASAPAVRSAATDPGLEAWRRLAAERPFAQPERPVPATDPWLAPPHPETTRADASDETAATGADTSGPDAPGATGDDAATAPIPGFDRGEGPHDDGRDADDRRSSPPSVD